MEMTFDMIELLQNLHTSQDVNFFDWNYGGFSDEYVLKEVDYCLDE